MAIGRPQAPRRTYDPNVIAVPRRPSASEPLTYQDLRRLPDDGRRYELLDGTLLVTPAPTTLHQRCVARLLLVLAPACEPDQEVLPAPVDWYVAATTVLEPDLVVVRRRDVGRRRLERVPVVAVEVLSPATRRRDLGDKRSAYEDAGLPHYWVVDPAVPSLTVFRLVAGRLERSAAAIGRTPLRLTEPFTVAVVPRALVER